MKPRYIGRGATILVALAILYMILTGVQEMPIGWAIGGLIALGVVWFFVGIYEGRNK